MKRILAALLVLAVLPTACGNNRVLIVKTQPPQNQSIHQQAMDGVFRVGEVAAQLLGLREIAEVDRTVAIVSAGVMGGNALGQLVTTGVITTGATVVRVNGDADKIEIVSGPDNSLEVRTEKKTEEK
jgi:hypothetical protein